MVLSLLCLFLQRNPLWSHHFRLPNHFCSTLKARHVSRSHTVNTEKSEQMTLNRFKYFDVLNGKISTLLLKIYPAAHLSCLTLESFSAQLCVEPHHPVGVWEFLLLEHLCALSSTLQFIHKDYTVEKNPKRTEWKSLDHAFRYKNNKE